MGTAHASHPLRVFWVHGRKGKGKNSQEAQEPIFASSPLLFCYIIGKYNMKQRGEFTSLNKAHRKRSFKYQTTLISVLSENL